MNENEQLDYSVVDKENPDHSSYVSDAAIDDDPYCISAPDELKGTGWFDVRNATLPEGVDLSRGRRYQSEPRAWDKKASDVPLRHPLRAIAKMLEDAPSSSTIRIKCYALSDWFALDLLIHYGASKIVKVIIDDEEKYVEKMEKFLKHYERFNSYDAFRRIEVRVAIRNHGPTCPNCSGYTSMHENRVITDSYSLFGSYNLTANARCKNWESCYVADSVQEEKDAFDLHWNALDSSRDITRVFPDFIPTEYSTLTAKKRRTS